MQIRPIKSVDNASLSKIIRSTLIEFGADHPGTAWQDPQLDSLFETYQIPGSIYYVVLEGGMVVGGAGIALLQGGNKGECELQKMYLSLDVRSKGYGQALLSSLLIWANQQKYSYCYLETLPNMQRAIHLYEKQGFSRLEKSMGATGHSKCGVYYGKALTN